MQILIKIFCKELLVALSWRVCLPGWHDFVSRFSWLCVVQSRLGARGSGGVISEIRALLKSLLEEVRANFKFSSFLSLKLQIMLPLVLRIGARLILLYCLPDEVS